MHGAQRHRAVPVRGGDVLDPGHALRMRVEAEGKLSAASRAAQRRGGGLPSALASSDASHSHTAQAWRNAERANASAAAPGSGAATTSAQSSTYSPSRASQRAAAGVSSAPAKPSGAGWA